MRLSFISISKNRGQNRSTPLGTWEESISVGSAFSMIWSHCGFQGVPPSSTFLMSIGVGGTGRTVCACEGVPIPMHNARLATDHRVFSTGIPVVGCARLLDIPESISLSWPESDGTIPVQAVRFWSLGDKLICIPSCPVTRTWLPPEGFTESLTAAIQSALGTTHE